MASTWLLLITQFIQDHQEICLTRHWGTTKNLSHDRKQATNSTSYHPEVMPYYVTLTTSIAAETILQLATVHFIIMRSYSGYAVV